MTAAIFLKLSDDADDPNASPEEEGGPPLPSSAPPPARPLLEVLPADMRHVLLNRLGPSGRGLLRHVNRATRRAVDDFVGGDYYALFLRAGRAIHLTDLCASVDLLLWSQSQGAPWHKSYWQRAVCCAAARGGHLEALMWARSEGCPPPVDQGDRRGDDSAPSPANEPAWESMAWVARQATGRRPCPWDERTPAAAAKGGHPELLKWAAWRGCPWDERTTAAAAARGDLELLRWVRARGCPWNSEVTRAAAEGGHDQVLDWAAENGCPVDETTYDYLARRGKAEGAVRKDPEDETQEGHNARNTWRSILLDPWMWVDISFSGFLCATMVA